MGVPPSGIGKKSYWQYAREAVWGTDLAAVYKQLIVSASNTSKPELTTPSALQDTIAPPTAIVTKHEAGLEVVTELGYNGFLELIDQCMGTDTYGSAGGVRTGGSSPYTWTYKQRALLNSLNAELIAGDIPTGKCEQFNGMKVASWGISGGEGSPLLKLSMTLFGKLLTTNVTPTAALSFTGSNNIRWADLSAFDDGSEDADKGLLKSFDLRVDNKVERREGGSLYTFEPIRNDYGDVALAFESEFSSRSQLDNYMAGTSNDCALVFTSGTQSLTITMPAGHIEPWGRTIETRGIVRQRFTWKSHEAGSSTASGLSIVMVTSDSAY